jgi:putative N6-adenine-specific DNA methylase
MTPTQLSCFAITAPGLEPVAGRELSALGIRNSPEEGGVAWTGELSSVAIANLWSRTASRVIVRVAEFHARTFFELERHAKRIPWDRFLAPGAPVSLRVTCRKSRLFHSDAVAQRLQESIERRLGTKSTQPSEPLDGDDGEGSGQLFIVRLLRDRCVVSVDTSGSLLHLRGYRQALAKAPLRETLAAATLLGSGWSGETPLTDPMCGSGTIPIEGAMIARRIAPGLRRTFKFLDWPESSEVRWDQIVADAEAMQLARTPVRIEGSDRDEGAIVAARANAERAGVCDDVDFSVRPISALDPASGRGLIATNPPYGVRVGESERLRNLYAQLGNVARSARPGWTLAMLSADPALERQLGVTLEERLRTVNGGIPVHLVVGRIET